MDRRAEALGMLNYSMSPLRRVADACESPTRAVLNYPISYNIQNFSKGTLVVRGCANLVASPLDIPASIESSFKASLV